MKILVTNHQLHQYTGSEVSTLTLCKYLSKKGNTVTVYSKYFSPPFIEEFNLNNIRTINNLDLIKKETFDIGHIQQNIPAFEIRKKFPKLPLVMWIHGVIPYLEQPPFIDLNISMFLVNNIEGKEYIKNKFNINPKKILIIRNIIDSEQFLPTSPINQKPQNALIISNKITLEKEQMLKKALDSLKINYKFIGSRFGSISHFELPKYINNSDIVFTVGLGAMETMMCGRIPILFDYNYAPYDDGIVTPENFNLFKEYNFSGRATKKIFDKKNLIKEIKKYKQQNGKELFELAQKNYDANTKVDLLIDIYKKVIEDFKPKKLSINDKNTLDHINKIIWETNYYTKSNLYINNPEFIKEIQSKLHQITDSKFFKLWPLYNKLKKIFTKTNYI